MIQKIIITLSLFVLVGLILQQEQKANAEFCLGYCPDTHTTYIQVDSNTRWSGNIMDATGGMASQQGSSTEQFKIPCGLYSAVFQKYSNGGYLKVSLVRDGLIVNQKFTTAAYGVVGISGICK
jgi:hypothetical protein